MSRRIGGFLLFITFAVAGCSGSDRRTFSGLEGEQTPVDGDWVIVQSDGEPDSLNQIVSTNAYSTNMYYGSMGSLVGETLLTYDPETWRLEAPVLAESFPDISDDHLVYTFTIRDGVQWHDGHPFSAADVLFSVKTLMLPLVDSAHLRGYFADLADVEILEGRKVRFTMRQPYWLNHSVLGSILPIVPKHVYDPDGVLDGFTYGDIISDRARNDAALRQFAENFNRHPANRQPLGTGPYRFERWDTGREVVITRNEDYWGERPHLDRIVFRIITDPTAALTALKSGSVDFYPRMTPIQHAQQTSDARFEEQFAKATYKIPAYAYIGWNLDRPFFADKRVRLALTMLVPREQILESVRFGLGDIAVGHYGSSSPDFNPNIKPWPYDPRRAAQLLDEAGWIDTDGDGVRDKDGVPFRFEFVGSSGSDFVDKLLPILREEFRRVGIDMRERRLEFTVMVENLRDRRFDAATLQWVSGLESDPHQIWHSSSIGNRGSNFVGFSNPEADRLIEEARRELDPDKRRQLYWRFQEILHEEQPYTFLFYPQDPAAFHRRFQHAEFIPARPGYDLRKWFVPAPLQRYAASQAQ